MPRRRAVLVVLLSVALPLLWSLDANLLLWGYDAYLSLIVSDGVTEDGRRTFSPGATPLEGATAWITGASSGIGAELAIQLAHAGIGHLILSGRKVEKLEVVAESCRAASSWKPNQKSKRTRSPVRVSLVPFDAAGGRDVLDDAISSALEAAGPPGVNILVLNAGRYHCGPALDTDAEVLPDLMKLNFEAPVHLSQKLMQKDEWKERGHGHIVTVASLMGRGASPLNAAYSASKHALRGYFHSLAAEERSWLRVDVVLPGATDTGLWAGSYNAQAASKEGDDSNNSQRPLHADDRSKMSVRRCAQLILSSIVGPSRLFFETWITRNPGLLWVYLASYAPMTFRLMANIIGPLRVSMWRRDGEDALYLPTLLGRLWECVADYASGRSDRLLP